MQHFPSRYLQNIFIPQKIRISDYAQNVTKDLIVVG